MIIENMRGLGRRKHAISAVVVANLAYREHRMRLSEPKGQ